MKINGSLLVFGGIKSDSFAFQSPVDGMDIDVSAEAPGTGLPAAAAGQRYVVSDAATPLGGWGSFVNRAGATVTLGNNDLIEYDGTNWIIIYDADVDGEGAVVYDKETNASRTFDGSTWATSAHPDGGDGITFNSGANRFDLDLFDTTPGLELTATDGSGELRLSAQGNGIAGGAGSLLSVDPATEVAGSRAAVYVDTDGVGINLDNSTLDHSSSILQVKDLGITAGKLASDSVITAKILDANVTVAKIEILAEGELIVGNGTANSKVNTGAVGDILSDETNGLTIKALAVDTAELADDAVTSAKIATGAVGADALDEANAKLQSQSFTMTGNGSHTTFTMTHSFGTQLVQVEIVDEGYQTIIPDSIDRTDGNTVVVTFNDAIPSALVYRAFLKEVGTAAEDAAVGS